MQTRDLIDPDKRAAFDYARDALGLSFQDAVEYLRQRQTLLDAMREATADDADLSRSSRESR